MFPCSIQAPLSHVGCQVSMKTPMPPGSGMGGQSLSPGTAQDSAQAGDLAATVSVTESKAIHRISSSFHTTHRRLSWTTRPCSACASTSGPAPPARRPNTECRCPPASRDRRQEPSRQKPLDIGTGPQGDCPASRPHRIGVTARPTDRNPGGRAPEGGGNTAGAVAGCAGRASAMTPRTVNPVRRRQRQRLERPTIPPCPRAPARRHSRPADGHPAPGREPGRFRAGLDRS